VPHLTKLLFEMKSQKFRNVFSKMEIWFAKRSSNRILSHDTWQTKMEIVMLDNGFQNFAISCGCNVAWAPPSTTVNFISLFILTFTMHERKPGKTIHSP